MAALWTCGAGAATNAPLNPSPGAAADRPPAVDNPGTPTQQVAVAVRLVPGRFGSLFFPDEPVRFTLEIENPAAQERRFEFTWRCRSLGAAAPGECSSGKGTRVMPAHASARVSILPGGADRLGVYDLDVTVRGEDGREFRPDGRFGRIQPPPATGCDRLGINIHVGTDEAAELVRLLGLGWVRIDWN